MNHEHDAVRLSLGAYLLGGLDAEEAREVERHVAGCAECAAELESLDMLPALLDAVPVERAMSLSRGPAVVDDDSAPPALLAKIRGRRRAARLRWGGALAGAAAAALLVGVALGPLVGGGSPAPVASPSGAPAQAVTARYTLTSADGVHVDVALVRKNWGTELDLSCRGMPSEGVFSVWIVAADGSAERAASWSSAGYGGTAVLTGATSQQPSGIRGIEIRDAGQRALASVTIG